MTPSARDQTAAGRRPVAGDLVVRLTLTTSILIVVTCLVLSVVLVRRHLADIRHGLVTRGSAVSEFIAREAELGVLSGDGDALHQLASVARGQPDVVYCRFFDRHGALLAAEGAGGAPGPPSLPAAGAVMPIETDPDVWEFRAAITTTAARRHREELLAGDADGRAGGAQRTPIGTVSIGIALDDLHDQRRLAFATAAVFTLVVALLAVAGAALLMHGTVRALATAAALAEERSRLAELKASFVTQASHEFRTPLAVILACADALGRYGGRMAPEQRQKRLTKIQTSVRHMTELLDDVLTLGRTESGKQPCVAEPVDVPALCREIAADVEDAGAKTRRVVVDCAGCGVHMLDPKLVRQIVRNLLANALKYSPAGGTVRLEVAADERTVRMAVADHGIGIPAEDREALFEPFHRGANVGKIPGSGLGLAITHRAVVLHHGRIDVQSVPGGGTTFVVTLPERETSGQPGDERAGAGSVRTASVAAAARPEG